MPVAIGITVILNQVKCNVTQLEVVAIIFKVSTECLKVHNTL